jgi:uncharacterized repeat protein (TIGR03803 family)
MQISKSGRTAGILGLIFISVAVSAMGQTFNTLAIFDGTNGGLPDWNLVQGRDGNFYGSAGFGGNEDLGTLFRITPEGVLTLLGNLEYSHLSLQGADGNFYGTTPYVGGAGSVFRMTPSGKLTTLYNFCSLAACADGQSPFGGVIQASDGNFYGSTSGGGAYGHGTIFKLSAAGVLTTLYSFNAQSFIDTALVEGNDGNFYGVTENGGKPVKGTVFQVTPQGALKTLHTFQGADGSAPYGALMLASDGNFYGTTYTGGASQSEECGGFGCGTIFRITAAGKLTTLYNFCLANGCPDGQWPSGDLFEGTDGSLYGTNQAGGANGYECVFGNCGTVFRITPAGELSTLHSFSGSDGSMPYAGVVQGTDGQFYGSTNMGADSSCGGGTGCGSLFTLSTELGPFVETRPLAGKVGETVTILGENLSAASSVSFGGVTASFQVIGDTTIRAKVPAGAATGVVDVATSARTLESRIAFRVVK